MVRQYQLLGGVMGLTSEMYLGPFILENGGPH